jgi:hypothetical protein
MICSRRVAVAVGSVLGVLASACIRSPSPLPPLPSPSPMHESASATAQPSNHSRSTHAITDDNPRQLYWDTITLPSSAYFDDANITTHSIFFYDDVDRFVYVIPQDFIGSPSPGGKTCSAFSLITPGVVLRTPIDSRSLMAGTGWEVIDGNVTNMPTMFFNPRATVYVPGRRLLYSYSPWSMLNVTTPSMIAAVQQYMHTAGMNATELFPIPEPSVAMFNLESQTWVVKSWAPGTPGVPATTEIPYLGISGMTHLLEPSGESIVATGAWSLYTSSSSSQSDVYRFNLSTMEWTQLAITSVVVTDTDMFLASAVLLMQPSYTTDNSLGFNLIAFSGLDWTRATA